MLTSRLPTPKEVRDLLAERLGHAVSLAAGVPYAPAALEPATYAVFVDEHLDTRAVLACDLPMSVRAGGAIATIPAGGLEAELGRATLGHVTGRHLKGLLEEFVALLDPTGEESVRLHAVYLPGEETPSDIPAYVRALGRRIDLVVAVAGYGEGRLSLVRPGR